VVTRDVTFDKRTKHGTFNNNEFGVMEETERNPESTKPVGEPTTNGADPNAEQQRKVVSKTSPGEGKLESEGSVGATRLQPETPKDSQRRSTGRVRRKPIELTLCQWKRTGMPRSVGVRSQFCSFVLLRCSLMHSTYAAYCITCAVAMKACAG
jgi:hypothetical protein